MSDPIRVVIADDQRLVRTGFRMILDAEPDIAVVGEAEDGVETLEQVARTLPDVVLMDIRMPRMDGVKATRELTQKNPKTRVVILTTFDLDEYVVEAIRAGASGFLLKDTPPETLLDAVRLVSSGDALLAPSVTRQLLDRFARVLPAPDQAVPADLSSLTDREVEVLRLIAHGLSNAEIASELYIGETTVKTHVARVLMKLRLRDRVQAVVLAYESGLIEPGRPQG